MLDSSAVRMCRPCRHSLTPQQRQTFRHSSICRQAKNGCMIHASLAAPRQREKLTALIPVEAGDIDAGNKFTAPDPWLHRLSSALHLKEFVGEKDFLKGLITLKYEILNHAKAVITPDTVSWNGLFELDYKDLNRNRIEPFPFRFKPEI
ncbi:hypothetical protein DER44DRAFT_816676 [Fusarium oxysporum]|nr:hypothetical protein DER44DRAFT_816676 [Fusarium oxysporum]